jgi:hypothetical protein
MYDKRIDTYIMKSAAFAQPILMRLRELVHIACPEVEETVKWGFPHFDYKGMMCSMASFKQHCSFGFWKASMMSDKHDLFKEVGKTSMGHLGQIRSMGDLPKDKILIDYIREAVKLNDEGVKVPAKPKAEAAKKALEAPGYFMKALKENKKALKTYEAFSLTNKKEYIEWVTGAKTEATRESRLAQAVELMAEGKVKNWKYIK